MTENVISLVLGLKNLLYCEGIISLFKEAIDFKIKGLFDSKDDFLEILKLNPDVYILDFDVFFEVRKFIPTDSSLRILLLNDPKYQTISDQQISFFISDGVVGILPTNTNQNLLIKSVKAVSQGEIWFSRKTIQNVIRNNNTSDLDLFHITKMEREIMNITHLRCGLKDP